MLHLYDRHSPLFVLLISPVAICFREGFFFLWPPLHLPFISSLFEWCFILELLGLLGGVTLIHHCLYMYKIGALMLEVVEVVGYLFLPVLLSSPCLKHLGVGKEAVRFGGGRSQSCHGFLVPPPKIPSRLHQPVRH